MQGGKKGGFYQGNIPQLQKWGLSQSMVFQFVGHPWQGQPDWQSQTTVLLPRLQPDFMKVIKSLASNHSRVVTVTSMSSTCMHSATHAQKCQQKWWASTCNHQIMRLHLHQIHMVGNTRQYTYLWKPLHMRCCIFMHYDCVRSYSEHIINRQPICANLKEKNMKYI